LHGNDALFDTISHLYSNFYPVAKKTLFYIITFSFITNCYKQLSIKYNLPSGGSHQHPMNKAAIVDKVHAVLGGTKAEAERVVDTIFDSIIASLKAGDEVSIAGFGIFEAKMRAARTARNPRTGETLKVPAMRTPKFRAAKALKEAVK
jgi:DNA-binding protein HU-beta